MYILTDHEFIRMAIIGFLILEDLNPCEQCRLTLG